MPAVKKFCIKFVLQIHKNREGSLHFFTAFKKEGGYMFGYSQNAKSIVKRF